MRHMLLVASVIVCLHRWLVCFDGCFGVMWSENVRKRVVVWWFYQHAHISLVVRIPLGVSSRKSPPPGGSQSHVRKYMHSSGHVQHGESWNWAEPTHHRLLSLSLTEGQHHPSSDIYMKGSLFLFAESLFGNEHAHTSLFQIRVLGQRGGPHINI